MPATPMGNVGGTSLAAGALFMVASGAAAERARSAGIPDPVIEGQAARYLRAKERWV